MDERSEKEEQNPKLKGNIFFKKFEAKQEPSSMNMHISFSNLDSSLFNSNLANFNNSNVSIQEKSLNHQSDGSGSKSPTMHDIKIIHQIKSKNSHKSIFHRESQISKEIKKGEEKEEEKSQGEFDSVKKKGTSIQEVIDEVNTPRITIKKLNTNSKGN